MAQFFDFDLNAYCSLYGGDDKAVEMAKRFDDAVNGGNTSIPTLEDIASEYGVSLSDLFKMCIASWAQNSKCENPYRHKDARNAYAVVLSGKIMSDYIGDNNPSIREGSDFIRRAAYYLTNQMHRYLQNEWFKVALQYFKHYGDDVENEWGDLDAWLTEKRFVWADDSLNDMVEYKVYRSNIER